MSLTWYDNVVCAFLALMITLNLVSFDIVGLTLNAFVFIVYKQWREEEDEMD